MNSTFKNIISACALLGCSAVAQAQLYVATGSSGVTTSFNFSINTGTNQVTVVVDNTHAGVGGVTGIVTSFGFNVPTGYAAGGSLLSTSGVPADTWSYFTPYSLSNFDQDAGAGSGQNVNGGQPNEGVQFGNSATFVFQFTNFDHVTGFLGQNGMSVKWQSQGDQAYGNPDTAGAPPIVPVPEPSTYGLIGAACLVLGTFVRRSMAKAKALA
ncbi:MAG: PEP-CTERM sorting domain-containing protein [Opitutaceae bacterium]